MADLKELKVFISRQSKYEDIKEKGPIAKAVHRCK